MEKILLATDFSAPAENAMLYAAALAKLFTSKLVLVHAYALPLPGYDSMAPLNVVGEMQSASEEALAQAKRKITDQLGYDPDVECITESSTVQGLIQEVCERSGVDLVVMGIVGNAGGLKKHLMGSSVIETMRNIAVPVMIVPETVSYSRISKMSFAFDSSDTDLLSILHSARSFAKQFNCSLELVNVRNNEPDQKASLNDEAIKKLLSGIDFSIVHPHGKNIAKTLEEHLKANPTDLVMLSPRRHNIFKSLFSSSLTEKLVYSLKTPILALHHD